MILVRTFLFILLSLGSSSIIHAIDVSISTVSYPSETSYVEVYGRFIGQSVQFRPTSPGIALQQARISVLMTISQNGDYVFAEKNEVSSPASEAITDFWYFKRIKLEPGQYTLDLTCIDLNNPTDSLKYSKQLIVDQYRATQSVSSDLLLMSEIDKDISVYPFERAAFSFEPLLFDTYGPGNKELIFYAEILSKQDEAEPLYYRYYVSLPDSSAYITKPAYKRIKSSDLGILEDFDISELGSGQYILNLEVITKTEELITHKTKKFSVYHPLTDYRQTYRRDDKFETSFVQLLDEGELNYALKAIFPVVGNRLTGMLNELIWSDDITTKRYFLYSYWSRVSQSDPKAVYNQYMEVARAVDNEYGANLGHGFESDRGYIFLKYGKPNNVISVEDEAPAPPYEIWLYHELPETNQTNVKFLFYNPTLAGNDMTLLHSTCRGERQNKQWEVELYRDDPSSVIDNSIDAINVEDRINRKARRYFSDI